MSCVTHEKEFVTPRMFVESSLYFMVSGFNSNWKLLHLLNCHRNVDWDHHNILGPTQTLSFRNRQPGCPTHWRYPNCNSSSCVSYHVRGFSSPNSAGLWSCNWYNILELCLCLKISAEIIQIIICRVPKNWTILWAGCYN